MLRRSQSESGLNSKGMRVFKSGQVVVRSNLPMESVVAVQAEWICKGEMMKLQELSTLISDTLKEWQDKEIVDSLGDQVWKGMDEEWTEHFYGEDKSPAFQKWTSRFAAKQAWAGVDEDLKGLKSHSLPCGDRKRLATWNWMVRSDPESELVCRK